MQRWKTSAAFRRSRRATGTRSGVCEPSIFLWEAQYSQSGDTVYAGSSGSFGYNPLLEAKTLAEQLVLHRTALGLFDPGTLARLERGESEPSGTFLDRVKCFIAGTDRQQAGARRAG